MRIAIITGASSGMGKEFVRQIDALYKELDEIWIVARREEILKKLKAKTKLRIFAGNLEERNIYNLLEEQLKEKTPDIRMLVNAAGFGKFGRVEQIAESDSDVQLRMIDLNCRALTKMTCLCLPFMSEGTRIINLASAAAFCPQCDFSVYAATKSYVLSFSRSLHRELRKRKISVTAVCPGPVKTEFFDVAGNAGNLAKGAIMAEADNVVNQALKDAKNRRTVSVYGYPMKASRMIAKLFPHDALIRIMELISKIQ